jgi:hypothetical protein
MATSQPSLAYRTATDLPIPESPPVIIATVQVLEYLPVSV